MDGVLIDSEPIWRRVETEVFARVGLDLTDEMLRETMGMRINEVVDHWYRRRPWPDARPDEIGEAILDGVVTAILKPADRDPARSSRSSTSRRAGSGSRSPRRRSTA